MTFLRWVYGDYSCVSTSLTTRSVTRLRGSTSTPAPILEVIDDDTGLFDDGAEAEVEVRRSPFEYVPEKTSLGKVELEYQLTLRGHLEAWHPIEDGDFGTSFTAFGRQNQKCLMEWDSSGRWMTRQCGEVERGLAIRRQNVNGVNGNRTPPRQPNKP